MAPDGTQEVVLSRSAEVRPAAHRSRTEWRELVSRRRRSGWTRRAFVRSVGASPNTLGWWACKPQVGAGDSGSVEIVVDPPVDTPGFQLELDGLRLLEPPGFDTRELRRLVDALC